MTSRKFYGSIILIGKIVDEEGLFIVLFAESFSRGCEENKRQDKTHRLGECLISNGLSAVTGLNEIQNIYISV